MKNSFLQSLFLVSIFLITFSYFSFFAEEVPQLQDVKQNQESTKSRLEISKYTQEGQAFLKAGKTNEAQQMALKIKNISEASPESYYLSGAVQYVLSNYIKAGKDLETAIRINPGHDQALFLIGMVYLKQNKIDPAIFYLEKACNEATYNPFYRFNLAIAYFAIGKFERAKIEAESTIRLKENYHKAKFLLASSLYKLNKKTESYAIIKDLYDKNIDRNEIQMLYLKLSTEEGKNYTEVIQILAKKNKLTLEEKKILAQVFMEEGDYVKAIQFYKMVFEGGMDTEEDNVNYLKSMIMIGKIEEAEKLFSAYNKKSHSEKKILIDTYYTTLEKKYFLSQVYQPYPL